MKLERHNDTRVDELEAAMLQSDVINLPLVHRFTPGMYIREIFMPAGSLVVSKIHKTTHPFTVSQGSVSVSIDGTDWSNFQAPHTGITYPGTRRILYIIDDCVWTTYHPLPWITGTENDLEQAEIDVLLAQIEDQILEPHINSITGNNVYDEYKRLINDNVKTIGI